MARHELAVERGVTARAGQCKACSALPEGALWFAALEQAHGTIRVQNQQQMLRLGPGRGTGRQRLDRRRVRLIGAGVVAQLEQPRTLGLERLGRRAARLVGRRHLRRHLRRCGRAAAGGGANARTTNDLKQFGKFLEAVAKSRQRGIESAFCGKKLAADRSVGRRGTTAQSICGSPLALARAGMMRTLCDMKTFSQRLPAAILPSSTGHTSPRVSRYSARASYAVCCWVGVSVVFAGATRLGVVN